MNRFAHFFIDRPIFAAVLSILIVLVGSLALITLPITQYPEIAPPTVLITTSYAGANAQVVAETVATPIEQEVNGVEDMLYMSSQSTNSGSMALTIAFKPGTNLDKAQVLVQNRVSLAEPRLPEDVRSVRDVIVLLLGQHQSTSPTLWIVRDRVKSVSILVITKIKLND